MSELIDASGCKEARSCLQYPQVAAERNKNRNERTPQSHQESSNRRIDARPIESEPTLRV